MASSTFDVIIIGCGPGGERAAIQAARAGRRVAVVERANVVGGARINWGTIPSKTLRESAIFVRSVTSKKQEGLDVRVPDEISMAEFMHREHAVVQRELELINRTLDGYHVEVFNGPGRFVDPHTVAILGDGGQTRAQLQGEVIIIATGSSPNHPDDVPFDPRRVLDSDSVLKLDRMAPGRAPRPGPAGPPQSRDIFFTVVRRRGDDPGIHHHRAAALSPMR